MWGRLKVLWRRPTYGPRPRPWQAASCQWSSCSSSSGTSSFQVVQGHGHPACAVQHRTGGRCSSRWGSDRRRLLRHSLHGGQGNASTVVPSALQQSEHLNPLGRINGGACELGKQVAVGATTRKHTDANSTPAAGKRYSHVPPLHTSFAPQALPHSRQLSLSVMVRDVPKRM